MTTTQGRPHVLNVRLTRAEQRMLAKLARRHGLSISAYLRFTVHRDFLGHRYARSRALAEGARKGKNGL